MLLKIIAYGDPILRRQAHQIEVIDEKITKLAADMIQTMKAVTGAGLAAPQIGHSIMMFVIDWSHYNHEYKNVEIYINPQFKQVSNRTVTQLEGCLSLPTLSAEVKRYNIIDVSYLSLEGLEINERLTGISARVFQHEFDHLNGVLYIDRLDKEARELLRPGLQAILSGEIRSFDPDDKSTWKWYGEGTFSQGPIRRKIGTRGPIRVKTN